MPWSRVAAAQSRRTVEPTDLWFGPYPSGTTFRLTQAPGGAVEVKPFTGAVQDKFTLNGDAELMGVDASGNSATTLCTVAPNTA